MCNRTLESATEQQKGAAYHRGGHKPGYGTQGSAKGSPVMFSIIVNSIGDNENSVTLRRRCKMKDSIYIYRHASGRDTYKHKHEHFILDKQGRPEYK